MTIGTVRSDLVEALHPISVVAVDSEGRVVGSLGDDLDRSFFLRSSIKPLQAAVAARHGADLVRERLAIAASSHSGWPVHIALVHSMLSDVELDAAALVCPPDRPSSRGADRLWASLGRTAPESVFHNCSGKHAGMLRACVAQGWSLEYAAPDHPLQRAIANSASDAVGALVTPTGVDGCGIPTLRSNVGGLARIFGRLATDPEYATVTRTVARFASLTADGTRVEARLARWLPAAVKGGAEGCIGIGLLEHGVAVGAKAWTGSLAAAAVGAVEVLRRLGLVPSHQLEMLAPVADPSIFGGGRRVGSLQLLDA